MALFKKKQTELVIPKHIAIIMDGNGRWAKKRGLPRTAGHAAGAEKALAGKYYLCNRVFGNRYCICRPRAVYLHALCHKGTGKFLHASRRVEYRLESREAALYLLLAEAWHRPGGEYVFNLRKFFGLCKHVALFKAEALVKSCFFFKS